MRHTLILLAGLALASVAGGCTDPTEARHREIYRGTFVETMTAGGTVDSAEVARKHYGVSPAEWGRIVEEAKAKGWDRDLPGPPR